jgi:dienelactone hydrolase
MSQENQQDAISKKMVVHQVPGVDDVAVRQDVKYRVTDDGTLTMDVYYPPDSKSGSRMPAVVFVFGYPDSTIKAMIGSKLKEMGQYISWGRLTAASGLVAIIYETREPTVDIRELLAYVRQNASSLGVDENRIAVWACSGNVPMALSVLMQGTSDYLKCAVLYYGFMLDCEGSNSVAEAAETVGFVNPCVGRTVDDLPQDVPLFIVRAGQDNPRLNETIDRFLGKAVVRNMPVTLTNYSDGPHAFDILDDSEISREIIRQTLAFMRLHLSA